MPFSKFVEIGRVAFIAFGSDQGRICAIVDVIDQNRALVDGPCSNVARQAVSFKQLHLTKFRIKFPHGASTRIVRGAWEKAKINEAWGETSWCRKLADKKKKDRITDFDRFKLMKAKQTRNRIIHREVIKLKAQKKKKMQKALKEARELRDKKKEERKMKKPKPKKMVKKDAPDAKKAKDAAAKKKTPAPKKAPVAQKAAAKPAKK